MAANLATRILTPELLTPCKKPPVGSVEIDWTHPLARDCVSYWLFGGHHAVKDIAGQNNVSSVTGSPALAAGRAGQAHSYGGSDASIATENGSLNVSRYTVFVHTEITAIPSPWGGIYAKGQGTNQSYGLQRNNTNDQFSVFHTDLLGIQLTNLKPSTIVNAGPVCLAVSYDGANVRAYLNGRETDVVAFTTNPTSAVNRFVFMGERGAASPYLSSGKLYSVGVYKRALWTAEAIALTADPYQILRPAGRQIFIPAAAADTSGAFASAAAVTTAFTGASLAAGSFTIAATATTSFTGAATAASTATISAESTPAFTGQALADASFTVTAESSAAFTGAAAAAASFAVDSSVAVAWTSSVIADGAFASASATSAAFIGASQAASAYSIASSAEAAFVGQSLAAGTFTSAAVVAAAWLSDSGAVASGAFTASAAVSAAFTGQWAIASTASVPVVVMASFAGQSLAASTGTITASVSALFTGAIAGSEVMNIVEREAAFQRTHSETGKFQRVRDDEVRF